MEGLAGKVRPGKVWPRERSTNSEESFDAMENFLFLKVCRHFFSLAVAGVACATVTAVAAFLPCRKVYFCLVFRPFPF